ncbi:MAG TPA: aminoacyl-tRNA hydrolase [Anaerolineales bacterium]
MSEGPLCLIVGLGNPGRQYRNNRHNAGFLLIDRIASEFDLRLESQRFESLVATGWHAGRRFLLAKPQTYVNETGRAVAGLVRFHRVEHPNLLVAFDDLDLELGNLRMRPFGGSSGHRGMRSLINHLGDQGFPRLRIGIGRPPGRLDPAGYVLSNFASDELELVSESLDRALGCVRRFLEAGIEKAMTDCNTRPEQ